MITLGKTDLFYLTRMLNRNNIEYVEDRDKGKILIAVEGGDKNHVTVFTFDSKDGTLKGVGAHS